MSLINDALKRASQSDRNRPIQAGLPRPMQPVAARPGNGNSWLLAAIIVAVLGFALAGWFLWKWRNPTNPTVAVAPIQPAQTIATTPPPVATAPAPIVRESPPPPATPVAAAPVIPTPPVPVAKPNWPIELTVKAIFYSKIHPRALVNGTTVEPGDKIDGVLVTGIDPDRVLVEWNGETRELVMGRQ
jgi:hypothetical protein